MVEACSKELSLSPRARSLWAKSDYGIGESWLPLFVHMSDSGKIAELLWDCWLPEGTKRIIARSLGADEGLARRLMVFLATVHDLGKATPVFQATPCGYGYEAEESSLKFKPEHAGLRFPSVYNPARLPKHPVAGQALLERYLEEKYGWQHARSFASILGCHHGKPSETVQVRHALEVQRKEMGLDDSDWTGAQEELILFAQGISGFEDRDMQDCASLALSAQAASIATGVVIMSDWIASNQELFPLVPLIAQSVDDSFARRDVVALEQLDARADRAWQQLNIHPSWAGQIERVASSDDFYQSRFGFSGSIKPYPIQESALQIAEDASNPGLIIIEAPMGEGKTEAALAAAEILASRTGRGGICVALPTMATTDAMFNRVHTWLEHMLDEYDSDAESVYLAHGKARLNEEYQGITRASFQSMSEMNADGDESEGRERLYVSDWMRGRKRGMLADFVVCTIDQVLMAGLGMKHLSLRHLALANKVVILDEIHACDAYMREYLKRALEWLGSWETPVVLLSATLPEGIRDELVGAYQQGRKFSSWTPPEPSQSGGYRKKRRKHGIPAVSATATETEAQAEKPSALCDAYPLITYTEGGEIKYESIPSSDRKTAVELTLIDDDDESLEQLLGDLLVDGGVAGVICDTVARAQHAAELLRAHMPDAEVMLAHSRFIDVDRMQNEARLRKKLGPKSSVVDGSRPRKAVFVGTQVLEQSLDIDFDVMVTDIAPIDLLMQRIGRLHRHPRGQDESDRPTKLRCARAYIRGIETWDEGLPKFNNGISTVYSAASLMEAIAVLGLVEPGTLADVRLPEDIAAKVRLSYSEEVRGCIPDRWDSSYIKACNKRDTQARDKIERANICRIPSIQDMCEGRKTLTDWYVLQVDQPSESFIDRNEERGQRAVRDTQESVEVLLLEEATSGEIRLLPWVGDNPHGVSYGAEVPTDEVPPQSVARVASQCSVRLPASMCQPEQIDQLINELEEKCGDRVSAWQESFWLAGSLPLFLHRATDESFVGEILSFKLAYSREEGLEVKQAGKGKK